MKRILLAFGLLLTAGKAFAGYPPYTGTTPPANGIVTQYLSGKICVAASSGTAGTCAILLDGTNGKVTGISFSTTAVIGSTSAVYIDGSLYGAGTVGSPIGVRSSSVAVLNVSGRIPNAYLNSSSVTLQGNTFNAAGGLVQLNGSAQLPAVDGSLLTGVAPLVNVAGSMYGTGTSEAPLGVNSSSVAVLSGGLIPSALLNSSSVTLQGNTFNGVSQLVQMTAAGKYPAADGSLITSVPPNLTVTAPITGAGTVASPLALNSAVVTEQGNTFNGVSQLVQTNGNGWLPLLDGRNLVNVSVTAGSLNSTTTITAPQFIASSAPATNGLGPSYLLERTGSLYYGGALWDYSDGTYDHLALGVGSNYQFLNNKVLDVLGNNGAAGGQFNIQSGVNFFLIRALNEYVHP